LIDGLEFPEDDIEIDADLSDSNGYLSEVCLLILYTDLLLPTKSYGLHYVRPLPFLASSNCNTTNRFIAWSICYKEFMYVTASYLGCYFCNRLLDS